MIFVTVGTQLPFDRLINCLDEWVGGGGAAGEKFFAQIGPAKVKPRFLDSAAFLPLAESERLVKSADLVVAHAGMGSILTALRFCKPIVIMPRMASKGEHRNEHQLATARWLSGRPGVTVAWDERQLIDLLERRELSQAGQVISEFAPEGLIKRLTDYIVQT